MFVRTIVRVAGSVTMVACGAGNPHTSDPSAFGGRDANPPDAAADGSIGEGRTAPLERAVSRAQDPDAQVQSLTDAEKGDLCDRWVAAFGGYDKAYPCENGHVESPLDRAECVARSFPPTCTVTVGQVERCASALMPSRGCTLQQGVVPPECAPFIESCSYRRPASH
jgi:hypothetical protein